MNPLTFMSQANAQYEGLLGAWSRHGVRVVNAAGYDAYLLDVDTQKQKWEEMLRELLTAAKFDKQVSICWVGDIPILSAIDKLPLVSLSAPAPAILASPASLRLPDCLFVDVETEAEIDGLAARITPATQRLVLKIKEASLTNSLRVAPPTPFASDAIVFGWGLQVDLERTLAPDTGVLALCNDSQVLDAKEPLPYTPMVYAGIEPAELDKLMDALPFARYLDVVQAPPPKAARYVTLAAAAEAKDEWMEVAVTSDYFGVILSLMY